MENPTIKPEIAPFKKLCMSIGAIPTSFQDSMDYYECVLWLIKYLENTIIPVVNNNGEAVAELQDLYITLKNYVENYFGNLDVQDEINNKLDEMAEDGELEEIISQYINKEVEYIFPKFWSNQPSQDISIIKGYDKNILIDCGLENNWSNILLMISSNLITHFDYFIVTHYDGDHIGNISNLITQGMIDSNTQVYLPVVPSNFSDKQATETSVKTMLTTNNIPYTTPNENDILSINNDFDIRFGNLNASYMVSNYTQYNATSMVCDVRHKRTHTFFAGDAFSQTYRYLDSINFITSQIDLYKQPHHGIDLTTYPQFVQKLKPINTVQLGGINDFQKNFHQCGETSLLIAQGTNYYPCYMSNDYVRFISNGFVINNTYGEKYSFSCRNNDIYLYVNANASNESIQDGTESHPFKELGQALGYLYNYPIGNATIYLADGEYNAQTSEVDVISSINNLSVTITGNNTSPQNVVINPMNILRSNITFNYVTFKGSNNPLLYINGGHCEFYHCNFTPNSTVARGIVATKGASIHVEDCTFNNLTSAIGGYLNATLTYGGTNNFGNATNIEENNSGLIGNAFIHDLPFTTSSNANTVKVNLTTYKEVRVYVRNKASNEVSQLYTIKNPTNNYNYGVTLYDFNNSSNKLIFYYLELRFRNTNTFYIDSERKFEITTAGAISHATASGEFEIAKIEAIS